MPLRFVLRSSVLLSVAAACSSGDPCEEGPFGGATCTIGGEIVTIDTLLFKSDVVTFQALAEYGLGPGVPQSVVWMVSDPSVLDLEPRQNGMLRVVAVDTGTAWVVAFINDEVTDSVRVTVVLAGAARWRSSFAGVPAGAYPAIGTDSLIRVVTGGAAPLLRLFTPATGSGTSTPGCYSALGPSLGASDIAIATGDGCTRRHAKSGDTVWTAPVGSAALGVAVVGDEGAITLSGDSVYRISAAGAVLWAQHLRGTPQTAPVIGPGGEIYVGWQVGGADSVSRFGLDGTPRWSVAVPGLSPGSPAVASGRLLFGRPGGLFALDTSSTVAWDRTFADANPGASATSHTSSPVHDGVVIFVQNEEALYAYAIGGTFVWATDSVGFGATSGVVGAPVVLSDLTLAVPCVAPAGGREVCTVRQSDGRLVWRSPLGSGAVDGFAVARDGMIYAIRSLAGGNSELVAMWGRAGPSVAGWPNEGGNPQHTRRR